MTISTKCLVDKINSRLAETLSADSSRQIVAAANALCSANLQSVATLNDLPSAGQNTGRLIFVESIRAYRFSNGSQWTNDFSSTYSSAGQLLSWGCNDSGLLGDNTIINKSSPVSVVGGFTDWSRVSAGYRHSVGTRNDGSLWAWGFNQYGRLGDNTTVNKSSPVSVVGGFTDWCRVSAGFGHSTAIRTNCTLWSWGQGLNGRLGDGTTVAKSSPVSVVGGFTDWCYVSSSVHNIAIRTNGSIWSWGRNNYGQLGVNDTADRSSPVSVVGGFTDWCQVSAGGLHTAALKSDGTVWTWGVGQGGRLGDNTIVNKSSPVSVVGGFTDWCQVGAGNAHTVAIRTNGTLWAWGGTSLFGSWGALGDGGSVNRSSPVSVVGGFTDWCQVSAGYQFTSAVRTNGTLWAWGCNPAGVIGDGTVANKSSPVSVIGSIADWGRVSSGRSILAVFCRTVKGF